MLKYEKYHEALFIFLTTFKLRILLEGMLVIMRAYVTNIHILSISIYLIEQSNGAQIRPLISPCYAKTKDKKLLVDSVSAIEQDFLCAPICSLVYSLF